MQTNTSTKAVNNAATFNNAKDLKKKGGWQDRLAEIIEANNLVKVKRKHSRDGTTSYRTREQRSKGMFLIITTLTKELGYKIEDPNNIKVKHIEALIKHWQEKELSAGTIELYLSNLRTLCGWMNKKGMVKPLKDYAPELKRLYAATHDKSFEGNEVDFWELWEKINAIDFYVALQILMVKAFGLRMKEAICFKPFIGDKEFAIEVFDGTKGGRPRLVMINTDFKMAVLCLVKNAILEKGNPKGYVGHPDRTLLQNMKRYSYVLGKCGVTKEELGVTGHGLRAEFAIDELIKRGIVPTVRGGLGSKLKSFDSKQAALMVAEELGHSRWSVMPAYGGKWMLVRIKDEFKLLEIRDEPLPEHEALMNEGIAKLQEIEKTLKEPSSKKEKSNAVQQRLDI